MSLTKSLPACAALSFASFAAHAVDGPPPPSVNQPSSINLGRTSFYDGFAGPPGLTHQTYLKFSTASSIRTNGGKKNGNFDYPKINVITMINQLSYDSPDTVTITKMLDGDSDQLTSLNGVTKRATTIGSAASPGSDFLTGTRPSKSRRPLSSGVRVVGVLLTQWGTERRGGGV
ncbi:hypothetical protein PS893_00455 [Pseudomonas fluorescens]|nr:hypothetical protein PS893_00455 [Pseudomonas fluorescens]